MLSRRARGCCTPRTTPGLGAQSGTALAATGVATDAVVLPWLDLGVEITTAGVAEAARRRRASASWQHHHPIYWSGMVRSCVQRIVVCHTEHIPGPSAATTLAIRGKARSGGPSPLAPARPEGCDQQGRSIVAVRLRARFLRGPVWCLVSGVWCKMRDGPGAANQPSPATGSRNARHGEHEPYLLEWS